jgi:hypothetical protein
VIAFISTARKRGAEVLAITTTAFAVTGAAGFLLVLADAVIAPFFGH